MSKAGMPIRPSPRPGPLPRPPRLICFPYAGGGPSIFRSWCSRLPNSTQLCSVELPGRGALWQQPPLDSLPEAVTATCDALKPFLECEFSLYGHSLGALVAFELARELRRRHGPRPLHIFVSGLGAPQVSFWQPRRTLHLLDDEGLIAELQRFGGTPRKVIEDRELMELMIPGIRAGLRQIETYEYQEEPALDVPISAFAGREDTLVALSKVGEWREQTTSRFSMLVLPGDHFGMLEGPQGVSAEVCRRLRGAPGGSGEVCPGTSC